MVEGERAGSRVRVGGSDKVVWAGVSPLEKNIPCSRTWRASRWVLLDDRRVKRISVAHRSTIWKEWMSSFGAQSICVSVKLVGNLF